MARRAYKEHRAEYSGMIESWDRARAEFIRRIQPKKRKRPVFRYPHPHEAERLQKQEKCGKRCYACEGCQVYDAIFGRKMKE